MCYGSKTGVNGADILLEDNSDFNLGNHNIKVIHTPGHTSGCTSYYTDGYIFTGDTFFIGGTGRNGSTLLANILGQTDNCINIGEALSFLLNYSRRERDLPCSCNKSINKCTFWSKNNF